MVRPTHSSKNRIKKNPLKWWRGLLGALLTLLIVVPYVMGADVEKYLHDWMEAINQQNHFHLEAVNYHRHWFTSEGDLNITGGRLPEKITIHFKAYHGPLLFFNRGNRVHLGLSYLKGSMDSKVVLGQQTTVKINGPIQLTAFVPYFSDRELHLKLPPITITDKANELIYLFNTVDGKLDDDGVLQMELPSLVVNRLNGTTILDLDTSFLRVLPNSHLASLTIKQIHIHFNKNNLGSINNFMVRASSEDNAPATDTVKLNLMLHFDQLKLPSEGPSLAEIGPFEFKLGSSGLRSEGFMVLGKTIRALSIQSQDLTPEQGEALEKSLANIFSSEAVFDFNGNLSTTSGEVSTQFQGGLAHGKPISLWQNAAELVGAFYSKGTVHLPAGVMKALTEYLASQPQPQGPGKPSQTGLDDKTTALSLVLGIFTQDTQGYSATIAMHNGRISLNGKDVKPSSDKHPNS